MNFRVLSRFQSPSMKCVGQAQTLGCATPTHRSVPAACGAVLVWDGNVSIKRASSAVAYQLVTAPCNNFLVSGLPDPGHFLWNFSSFTFSCIDATRPQDRKVANCDGLWTLLTAASHCKGSPSMVPLSAGPATSLKTSRCSAHGNGRLGQALSTPDSKGVYGSLRNTQWGFVF
jgi:hypothetical protein